MLVSKTTEKSTVLFNVLGKEFGQLCIEALRYGSFTQFFCYGSYNRLHSYILSLKIYLKSVQHRIFLIKH